MIPSQTEVAAAAWPRWKFQSDPYHPGGLVYLPTICLYGYKLVGKYASPMDCEISDTLCFLLSLGDLQIVPRIVPKKHKKWIWSSYNISPTWISLKFSRISLTITTIWGPNHSCDVAMKFRLRPRVPRCMMQVTLLVAREYNIYIYMWVFSKILVP